MGGLTSGSTRPLDSFPFIVYIFDNVEGFMLAAGYPRRWARLTVAPCDRQKKILPSGMAQPRGGPTTHSTSTPRLHPFHDASSRRRLNACARRRLIRALDTRCLVNATAHLRLAGHEPSALLEAQPAVCCLFS